MYSTSATAEISLDAIARNLDVVRQNAPGAKVMAVIKANAYGHGGVEVARKLVGADAFAVARLHEAMLLREAGISSPVTLLEGVMDEQELNLAIEHDLDVVVHSPHQVAMLDDRSPTGVWLKVDTGMHRLGLTPAQAPEALGRLSRHRVLGVMTHLANADNLENAQVVEQLAAFKPLAESMGLPTSVANSAGILAHPSSVTDWVRPGLMLYGASPFGVSRRVPELAPAMTLTAPVIAINNIQPGESVGYGSEWTADKPTRVATVAIGYADGFPREAGAAARVVFNGRKHSLAGRVSMDMLCIEVKSGIAVGDRVECWGNNRLIDDVAETAKTIAYTLMCGVGMRVPRVYSGGVA